MQWGLAVTDQGSLGPSDTTGDAVLLTRKSSFLQKEKNQDWAKGCPKFTDATCKKNSVKLWFYPLFIPCYLSQISVSLSVHLSTGHALPSPMSVSFGGHQVVCLVCLADL